MSAAGRGLRTGLRLGLAGLLVAFLVRPAAFAGLLAPFAAGGRPAVYTQTPMLALAASHLALTAAAVGAAAAVAVAAGVFVTRPAGREFLPLARTLAGIGQTFPPVAVLALAVPALGFGAGPTLVALFLYALLPILEMTMAGLEQQPAEVAEAARGMGMTGWQRLTLVDLPLATPAILAGIRVAAVISLSTATIGSTVAARTLGEVIVAGLQTGNGAFVLQGALAVGGLAIAFNAAFQALERRAQARAGWRPASTGPGAATGRLRGPGAG